MPKKSTFALAVFSLALACRLGYALTQPEAYRDEDEAIYVTIARNLIAGRGLILNEYRRAAFPPLYPLFLAGLFTLGWKTIKAVRLVQAFVGALSCLGLLGAARLALETERERKNFGAAELAALLMAVYPLFIFYDAQLMTETLFIFLLLMSVHCLLKSSFGRSETGWSGLAGMCAGLGMLCRPTLLPLALLFPLWSALVLPVRKRLAARTLGFILPLILIILPWGVRNYRLFHRLVPITTQSGNILYLANNPLSTGGTVGIRKLIDGGVYHAGDEEGELKHAGTYGRRALAYIKSHPGRFLFLSGKRLAWFYHLDGHNRRWYLLLPFWGIVATGVAGIWLSRARWRKAGLFWLVILNFSAVHMIFPPEGRYRLPLIPFLLAFSAVTVMRLPELFRLRFGRGGKT